jgi:hypothetical protein
MSAWMSLGWAAAQTAKPAVAKRTPVAVNPKAKIDLGKVESRFGSSSGDALTTSSSIAPLSNLTAPPFALSSGMMLVGVSPNPGVSAKFAAIDAPQPSAGEVSISMTDTAVTAVQGVTPKLNADLYPSRGDSAALLQRPLLGATSSALAAASVVPVAAELNGSVRGGGLKASGERANFNFGNAAALGGMSSTVSPSSSKLALVVPPSLAAAAAPSSALLSGFDEPSKSRQGLLTAVKINHTQASMAVARPLLPTGVNKSAIYHLK